MKKILTTLTMALALGIGGAYTPVQADEYWDDYDAGLWETDNWAEDEYGIYDNDFGWEATGDDWDTWYGDTYNDWDTYDDAGDGGWFDV